MLVTSIFTYSHNVFFYPNKHKLHHWNQVDFAVCKCFGFVQIKNFVLWYWVNTLLSTLSPFGDFKHLITKLKKRNFKIKQKHLTTESKRKTQH